MVAVVEKRDDRVILSKEAFEIYLKSAFEEGQANPFNGKMTFNWSKSPTEKDIYNVIAVSEYASMPITGVFMNGEPLATGDSRV